jgi:hypothetical protein
MSKACERRVRLWVRPDEPLILLIGADACTLVSACLSCDLFTAGARREFEQSFRKVLTCSGRDPRTAFICGSRKFKGGGKSPDERCRFPESPCFGAAICAKGNQKL